MREARYAGTKTLVLRQGFSFFRRGPRPPFLFSPAAGARGRRLHQLFISKKHLTNLIVNCKNDYYRPVYK